MAHRGLRATCFNCPLPLVSAPLHSICFRKRLHCSTTVNSEATSSDVDFGDHSTEFAAARREKRPIRIDTSTLSLRQRQLLRLRSKAIPLVADFDPLDIVFEDDVYLVVNKPSAIKMHPSHRFEGGSLLNRAIGYLGYSPYILHRLDMHTTGVVVFAKTKQVCKPIMKQFADSKVNKRYLCVVDGMKEEGRPNQFEVDAPIQRHEVSFVREVGETKSDSKPAQTLFTILDESTTSGMMLLEAAPKTGRTHQIRVHASHYGLPIVGDDLYNPKENSMYDSWDEVSLAAKHTLLLRYGDDNVLRRGLKLHAWKITLNNPLNNEIMTFCAKPPAHMNALLEEAGMRTPEN